MHYDVIVTGGLGFIGSHFVKLIIPKASVLVLDNKSTGNSRYVRDNCDVIDVDLRFIDELKYKLQGVTADSIIHFAASAYVGESVKHPLLYAENNITSLINLLSVSDSLNIDNFIFSSSCATYGDVASNIGITEQQEQKPINPYGWTKLVGEQLLKQSRSKMRIAILRYFNAAGCDPEGTIGEEHDPETHLIPLVINAALCQKYPEIFPHSEFNLYGVDYSTPDGTCIRDYIHVTDLCQAHYNILEYISLEPTGAIIELNLGAGFGTSIHEVIEEVQGQLDITVQYRTSDRREGDPAALTADISQAKKMINFNPKYSNIETIVKDVLNFKLRKIS